MGSGHETPRGLAGAVLADLAVSPMFAWDIFAGAFAHRLGAGASSLTLVFSVGLACFTWACSGEDALPTGFRPAGWRF